ncbi:MAG: O-antigen ligase family protein [Solirubrobacterales bacterium]
MSEALEVAGCIAAAASAALALLTSDSRLRAAGLLLAMGFATALIAGQGWDDIQTLRDHPAAFAAAIAGAVVILILIAAAMLRWPILLPLLIVATLPFRIRLHVAGGQAVNLLVPLYVVLGAGVLATAVDAVRHAAPPRAIPRPLVLALVVVIVLYALQSIYSEDVAFAARNMGFFVAPFAVLFSLLAQAEWDRRLLRLAFAVVLAEGLVLALIGIGQFAGEHIFWNGKLEASNDFHFYFRVNSLFWDPNIYGRYLMLSILLGTAALTWASDRRLALALTAVIGVVFVGLLFGFSQTTFFALFVGLAVLVALRWSVRWAAVATPLALAGIVLAVIAIGSGSGESTRTVTEGHSSLVSGGVKLAEHRPIWGYGSASFSKAFARAEDVRAGDTTISHTEPVTVAAEQGVVGIVAYVALLAAALWTVFGGMRSIAPGLGAPFRQFRDGNRAELGPARIAIAAAFLALLVHTIGYAAYLTDPLTWALLAVGAVLAAEAGAGGWPAALLPASGEGTRQSPG